MPGRHYLAIPGPSVIPDRVLREMHRAAPNIYTGELIEMVPALLPDLRKIAGTRHDVALYIGNGHAAWEAAIANMFDPSQKVLVLATGHFAHGWADVARSLGVDVTVLEFGKRASIDNARVAEALEADKAHEFKAVLAVHTDTSTSVRNDIKSLRETIDLVGHPALLMVDCIASLGCDRFEMDAWGVDVMVAACQKGLMTPPGMAMVYFGRKADAQRASRVSVYWDWRPRTRPEAFYQYFAGTAPTHHLYGLREALAMISEEGLDNVFSRHAKLARAYWAALETWGQGGPVEMNIADPAARSHSVTSVRLGSPHGTALRDWLTQNTGVTLGIGLGMAPAGDPAWHGYFRIGHMGHVNAHMVLGTIGAMDAGLKALDIPHGSGACEAAAQVIAQR